MKGGVVVLPPKQLGAWQWNYQMLSSVGRCKICKKKEKTYLVCKLWVRRVPTTIKYLVYRKVTFKYGNLTKFCTIVNITVRKWPKEFQINISKIDYFIDQNTERSVKCEVANVTSPNLLSDLLSPISRHWPSFKCFWL